MKWLKNLYSKKIEYPDGWQIIRLEDGWYVLPFLNKKMDNLKGGKAVIIKTGCIKLPEIEREIL